MKVDFADGTHVLADVVLGADGIKSVVRGAVTGQDPSVNLSFSNTVCYRGLVPVKVAQAAGVTRNYSVRPICYVGQSKVRMPAVVTGLLSLTRARTACHCVWNQQKHVGAALYDLCIRAVG